MKKTAFVLFGVLMVCCAAAYGGNGSHGGSPKTKVEQSVSVGSDVVVEESVVVEGSPKNVTVVEEVIVNEGGGTCYDQPPALRQQKADARKAKRSAIKAAELEHRAYRLGRKANAAAVQQRKVVAAEQAYEAAD